MTMRWQGEPDRDALDSALSTMRAEPNVAIRELERLADLGSLMSMFYLAAIYGGNEFSRRDIDKSLYWQKRAADGGLVMSKYYVGLHYLRSKQYDEALKWLIGASNVNFAPACNALAGMHFRGIGVKKDIEQASKYWKRAIADGHIIAKRDMAIAMIFGAFGSGGIIRGIPQYFKAVREILITRKVDLYSDRLR